MFLSTLGPLRTVCPQDREAARVPKLTSPGSSSWLRADVEFRRYQLVENRLSEQLLKRHPQTEVHGPRAVRWAHHV